MKNLLHRIKTLTYTEKIINSLLDRHYIAVRIIQSEDVRKTLTEMDELSSYDYKKLKQCYLQLINAFYLNNNKHINPENIDGFTDRSISEGDISAAENFDQDLYHYALSLSFPEKFSFDKEKSALYDFFMLLIRELYSQEALNDTSSVYHKYKVELLDQDVFTKFESSEEYKSFIKAYYNLYIYEVMRLGRQLKGFNTIDHVIMIHFLSMHIAFQMDSCGFDVDLGKVSTASLGHDIGKFGCIGDEVARVPYLHYYYTDKWFKSNSMPSLSHIATNHSVWDLELENLPVESLILIYSDFRVKNDPDFNMNIFSLSQSFEVILNKLDNVDEVKKQRYLRAYSKLMDFENYIVSQGIDILDSAKSNISGTSKPYSLLFNEEITQGLKFYSISKNIKIMHLLRSEGSLNELLENARTERNPILLREYINVFREYSTHLSQKQKLLMIKFLFDMLINPQEDIRIESAYLMARLVSDFDEEYRKELPKGVNPDTAEDDSISLYYRYSARMLDSSSKFIPVHKKWLGISFSYFSKNVSLYIPSDKTAQFEESFLKLVERYSPFRDVLSYILLGIINISLKNETAVKKVMDFVFRYVYDKNNDIKCLSLLAIIGYRYALLDDAEKTGKIRLLLETQMAEDDPIAVVYLYSELSRAFEMDEMHEYYQSVMDSKKAKLSEIFLSDLKSATSFVQKIVHIDILRKNALDNLMYTGAYTAMHFCNILKVSEIEVVRNKAGNSVIELFPYLNIEQRNDIAIELIRSLEMQDYKYAKFIPYYLGEIILHLTPKEFDEIIDDFEIKIKTSSSSLNLLILKTIGRCVSLYSRYLKTSYETANVLETNTFKRLFRLIGIVISALVNYDKKVRTAALDVLSKSVFSSPALDEEIKMIIFQKTAKKILTLLAPNSDNISHLSLGASMNRIYRYISDYQLENGPIEYPHSNKIAFFPGTFDPFTLSHKSIAKTIRDMGYEVYLAVDEFSWSKRTQPHMIRREIVRMSVADEFDIYLFPSSISINIANDKDVKKLRECFGKKELFMATGKDVVLSASAYKRDSLIRHLPHIIFERPDADSPADDEQTLDIIAAENIVLTLEDEYSHISSTLIRNSIDQGKDVSNMVDPLCEKYIYEKGLYKKEPLFKTEVKTVNRRIRIVKAPDKSTLKFLAEKFSEVSLEMLLEFALDDNVRCIILEDNQGRTIGFSVFKWLASTGLYSTFNDSKISDFIRNTYVGRMVYLGGVFGDYNSCQILLTETLTFSLEKDYTFMIYSDELLKSPDPQTEEMIELSGFTRINTERSIYFVNMSNPCTLNLDIENYIKEPFLSSQALKEVIHTTRKRLREAISGLYPSNLLISFDNAMFNQKLISKICEENNVPDYPLYPKELGEKMCVPFGQILSKLIIPNTVSKSLHTEKLFSRDLESFSIRAYPYYMNLEGQMRTIKSFDKPVILVDDILNKGYRINALDPLLNAYDINVAKVIVGILTGKGKELMQIQNREVESAYFIPKLKVWFNESVLYPFISGDGVEKNEFFGSMIPSVNLIMPYASPHYIKDTTNHALYRLSQVCLENSKMILMALEDEYERIFERKLTVSSLNEVLNYPRVVDYGDNLLYSKNISASSYISDDIEKLSRLKKTILK